MLHKEQRYEKGNIIDELGCILIIAFIFALILVFSSYGKATQLHLEINNIAKEYLYKMEETGYLSEEDEAALKANMIAIGATEIVVEATTTTTQVPYGGKVTLAMNVTMTNPLYSTFGKDSSMFHIGGFSETLTYPVCMSSTSKW